MCFKKLTILDLNSHIIFYEYFPTSYQNKGFVFVVFLTFACCLSLNCKTKPTRR